MIDPFILPPFEDFTPDAILAALDLAIDRHRHAIDSIVEAGGGSFEDVWLPLERAETAMNALWSVVSHLRDVADSPETRATFNEGQGTLVNHVVGANQNPDLFAVLARFCESEDFRRLPAADRVAVERSVRDRRLAGVALDPEQREQYREISLRLSVLASQFNAAVLDATEAWSEHVTDKATLAGISAEDMARFALAARDRGLEGWCITLHQSSVSAVMSFAEDRELRRRIYHAAGTKASDQGPYAGIHDNSAAMAEILVLRRQVAALLGFSNPAEWSLATKMAASPEDVVSFLRDLGDRARPAALREIEELREFGKEELKLDALEPWDIAFASERLRSQRYTVDEQEIRAYFPIERVFEGWEGLLKDLFGVRLALNSEAVSWHEDVRYFDVFDEDGKLLAGLYLDLHARTGKRGGAWMSPARPRLRDGNRSGMPVAYLTCNFAPRAGDVPPLLSHWDVQTLLHETGHALHQIFTLVDRPAIGGIRGFEWDAVELPSQVMEDFAWNRDVLTAMSGHYETGRRLPDDIYERLLATRHFQSGMSLVRQIELALFDMLLHLAEEPEEPMAVLQRVRDEVSVVRPPEWHRFPHSFSHIFAGGYAAGYYSYLWAEVLAADAFEAFARKGVVDSATGDRFRGEVLARGASRSASESFHAFMGRESDHSALLRRRGLEV
ncbi:M3 family metallopeptidase [Novosphingobium sp. ZW T3_23]|uniref:M3 family metallopeptidase n=1 Tax=Novosphingobium sp. ZW T3_23 TaxID=3378084 RepID=UPI003854B407